MSEVYYREDVYAFIETDEFAFLFALHFVDANFNTAWLGCITSVSLPSHTFPGNQNQYLVQILVPVTSCVLIWRKEANGFRNYFRIK